MDNLFKKLIYTGIGVAAQAKDRLEKTITELVEEEKLSTKEGKRIVDEFLKSTDSKKEEVEQEVNGLVEKIVKKLSFASCNDVKELEDRIEALEALVAGIKPSDDAEENVAPKRHSAKADDQEEITE